VVFRVGVKQPTDHPLILRIVLPRFVLEERNATLAQRNSDFHSFVPKDKVFGAREKVSDDL